MLVITSMDMFQNILLCYNDLIDLTLIQKDYQIQHSSIGYDLIQQ